MASKEYLQEWRRKKKAKGLCARCGKRPVQKEGRSNCAKCIEESTWSGLKSRYGLSRNEYELLGDACKICGRSGSRKTMHVDHDHDTNQVRGLLCSACNSILGWAESWGGNDVLYLIAEYMNSLPQKQTALWKYDPNHNRRRRKSPIFELPINPQLPLF